MLADFSTYAQILDAYFMMRLRKDDKPDAPRNTGSVQRRTGGSDLQVFR